VAVTSLHNEKALLERVAQGDESAFRIVFDHYRDAIYAFALKVTRHESIAEEIVQDVFMKIWISRTGLPAVRQLADLPWLLPIVFCPLPWVLVYCLLPIGYWLLPFACYPVAFFTKGFYLAKCFFH
jgi:hypothetical protein